MRIQRGREEQPSVPVPLPNGKCKNTQYLRLITNYSCYFLQYNFFSAVFCFAVWDIKRSHKPGSVGLTFLVFKRNQLMRCISSNVQPGGVCRGRVQLECSCRSCAAAFGFCCMRDFFQLQTGIMWHGACMWRVHEQHMVGLRRMMQAEIT